MMETDGMTVNELIELLNELPQHLTVCVRGYEDGIDDVGAASVVRAALNVNTAWYYGDHEVIRHDADETRHASAEIVDVVLLHVAEE